MEAKGGRCPVLIYCLSTGLFINLRMLSEYRLCFLKSKIISATFVWGFLNNGKCMRGYNSMILWAILKFSRSIRICSCLRELLCKLIFGFRSWSYAWDILFGSYDYVSLSTSFIEFLPFYQFKSRPDFARASHCLYLWIFAFLQKSMNKEYIVKESDR